MKASSLQSHGQTVVVVTTDRMLLSHLASLLLPWHAVLAEYEQIGVTHQK